MDIIRKLETIMTDVFLVDSVGTSDHCHISFEITVGNDMAGPRVKILNWGRRNFDGTHRLVLTQIDPTRFLQAKERPKSWDALMV